MGALEIAKKLLYDREGKVNKVYKDSLGLLTAGVGHLLTEKEQKLHPLGSYIPDKLIDDWFDHDVQRAYNTSLHQAEDLNLEYEDFIAALISVNFQLGDFSVKFKNSYALLKKSKFDEVIKNLRKSLWCQQTPIRVEDFIRSIERLKVQL